MRGMLSDCTGVGSLSGTALSGIYSVPERASLQTINLWLCAVPFLYFTEGNSKHPDPCGTRIAKAIEETYSHSISSTPRISSGISPSSSKADIIACRWPAGHSSCRSSLHVAECQQGFRVYSAHRAAVIVIACLKRSHNAVLMPLAALNAHSNLVSEHWAVSGHAQQARHAQHAHTLRRVLL